MSMPHTCTTVVHFTSHRKSQVALDLMHSTKSTPCRGIVNSIRAASTSTCPFRIQSVCAWNFATRHVFQELVFSVSCCWFRFSAFRFAHYTVCTAKHTHTHTNAYIHSLPGQTESRLPPRGFVFFVIKIVQWDNMIGPHSYGHVRATKSSINLLRIGVLLFLGK